MTEDDVNDIVDDWHRGLYGKEMTLDDVFILEYNWTYAECKEWAETGRVPNE